MDDYDFCGWATKHGIECSDGRTIMKDAFKDNDGKRVPLVWSHIHNDPSMVIGHADLENRDEGVYARCKFNNSESGQATKLIVEHGDVTSLSIFANQLKQYKANVVHGNIREVSVVLAGANPGAYINQHLSHGEDSEDEAIIYNDSEELVLAHSDEKDIDHSEEAEIVHADDKDDKSKEKKEEPMEEKAPEKKPESEESLHDIFETLDEKQKNVVYALIAEAAQGGEDEEETEEKEGGSTMKHNVFDQEEATQENVLSHSDVEAIFAEGKRLGSLKEGVLQHGITDIDYLFPEAQTLNTPPEFIKRKDDWVSRLMGAVHHTPFSRIKSMFANLTADEARAKGYVKGNLKIEEVFTLLKRTTTPTTIYKKQKLDRDDIVDITDFDVVAWLKSEMRMMLDEEIARAMLVGDGRLGSSDDKISEEHIRPIWKDDDLYTIKQTVTVAANDTADQKAKKFIRECVKSRKDYRGSGNPDLYTTEDVLTDCLLMEDTQGRIIYETKDKLATALRVKDIITVPVMENLTRTVSGTTRTLKGIIVNPDDYNLGADKGGAVNMFDDFDIDFNQQKYLIETRCSGALTKPYSAIALEEVTATASAS